MVVPSRVLNPVRKHRVVAAGPFVPDRARTRGSFSLLLILRKLFPKSGLEQKSFGKNRFKSGNKISVSRHYDNSAFVKNSLSSSPIEARILTTGEFKELGRLRVGRLLGKLTDAQKRRLDALEGFVERAQRVGKS